MMRFLPLVLLPVSLLAQASPVAAPAPVAAPVSTIKLTARAERPSALYKTNESVKLQHRTPRSRQADGQR